jgi:hypothetical protein
LLTLPGCSQNQETDISEEELEQELQNVLEIE